MGDIYRGWNLEDSVFGFDQVRFSIQFDGHVFQHLSINPVLRADRDITAIACAISEAFRVVRHMS